MSTDTNGLNIPEYLEPVDSGEDTTGLNIPEYIEPVDSGEETTGFNIPEYIERVDSGEDTTGLNIPEYLKPVDSGEETTGFNIPEYIERVDSGEDTTGLNIPEYLKPVDSGEETTGLNIPEYLELVDSGEDTPEHTEQTSKDKGLDNTKLLDKPIPGSSLWHNTKRQLPGPGVNGKKLIFKGRTRKNDSEVNKFFSVSTRATGRRPTYEEVPRLLASSETHNYSQLDPVQDDYEEPRPVQPVANVNNTQHNAASKRCVVLSAASILVALLVVLAAVLIAVFGSRDKIETRMDTELSSLLKTQYEINKTLDSMLKICGNCKKAAPNLTVVHADSCYCLYLKKLFWKDAKDFCLAIGNGVHLAEIYKPEENDFLMRVLQTIETEQGIWLGGSDLDTEGTWVWNYTGKPIEPFEPSQWLPNEPSAISPLKSKEDCLEVYNWEFPTYKWNDHSCDSRLFLLCKSPLLLSKCFC